VQLLITGFDVGLKSSYKLNNDPFNLDQDYAADTPGLHRRYLSPLFKSKSLSTSIYELMFARQRKSGGNKSGSDTVQLLCAKEAPLS